MSDPRQRGAGGSTSKRKREGRAESTPRHSTVVNGCRHSAGWGAPDFDAIPLREGRFCVVNRNKIPLSPTTGDPLSTNEPAEWGSFEQARAAVEAGKGKVIGRLVEAADGYAAVDLDDCIADDGFSLEPWAERLVDLLNSYVEFSPSGTGLRVLIKADGLPHDFTNSDAGVEVYKGDSGRYVTLTGHVLHNRPIKPPSAEAIEELYQYATKSSKAVEAAGEMPPLLDEAETLAKLRAVQAHLTPEDERTLSGSFRPDDDRSRLVAGLVKRLALLGLDAQERLSVAFYMPGPMAVALDHRRQNQDKALRYLWKHHVVPSQPFEMDPVAGLGDVPDDQKTSPLDWTRRFMLTTDEANQISDPEWIEPYLFVRGHVIVLASQPNGGKTTIAFHLAGKWAAQGYQVVYVNADVSASDAKRMVHEADRQGFQLLLPDMKAGLSMADVVKHLEHMAETGGDFSNVVMIFDTLKKMTDVINKAVAKGLYKTLRSLSAKGMTVIALAHTNKYLGPDGKPIYEGTGDLRADVDELIYLIPQKHDDGSMTVSAEPDKVRAALKPMTFSIAPDRTVTVRDYVNVAAVILEEQQREKDAPTIEAITEALDGGKYKQVEIIAHCAEYKIGKRTVMAVLQRYKGDLWHRRKGMERNAWHYEIRTPGNCDNWEN